MADMALTGTTAAPACLLLLLAFLPSWGTQTGPQEKPLTDVVFSRQNLKQIIKLLGTFVKEKVTLSSVRTQETTFPNSYPVPVGNKLHKSSPNILMDAPGRHNKVKGAGTKEDTKERTLLSDRNAEDNGGRSVRTTNALNVHSAENSSKTQIDTYNLKDSREIPEVHIVAGNVTSQGFKIDSRELKDGSVQVVTNSSMNKKVKHVPEKKRRKALLIPDRGMTGKSTTEDSKRNIPVTGSFVEENATPSSLTTQETTFPSSSSVSIRNQLHSTTPNILVNATFPNSSSVSIGNQLHSTTPNILVNATFPSSSSVSIGNQLHSTTPNILVNATGRHNKGKGAGNKEDTKERTLLSDRNAEDNGGSSVRTTTNALNVHSADNTSKTQIDTYDLKDSREIPEVHIVAGNITSQDSGELKDGGVQVVTNSSMNKNVPEKGRRNTLLKPDPGMTGKSTTENNERNLPVTGSFVEESATSSSLTTQETTFPSSSSVSIGNQLHSTTPNILVNAPGRHNKGKGAETKEDILERTLLSDRNAEDNGDRSVRTTTNALNVHSTTEDSRRNLPVTESQIQVPQQRHLILEHELPKKQDKSKKVHMRVLKVLKPLKVIYMEKPTSEPLFFEERNPTVTKDHKDRLQSLMKQEAAELSVKVLEKLLCFLKKEEEMQKSLSPYEKIQSSIMENILQELKEQKGPGEADSSEVELKITLKPFLEESSTVPDSNEILLEQSTTVPNMTDEDVKDAKSLEYEGVEDEKRAKAAGARDLLKDVIIACVAITALILAVIVLVHICISLFVKKKQEPV